MNGFEVSLDELVSHRPPMRFLDRMISVSDSEAVAETLVRADNPLFVAGAGLPGYAGLEMMAQAIAAIDGMKRKAGGLPPKIGFLLGCRRYSVLCADFAEGMRLRIVAKMVFTNGEMFNFECRIEDETGKELALASMNVYAPADPAAFLKAGAA
jgi:predicted hotdog family 3-hydroxylacyl-ACP dehydratase